MDIKTGIMMVSKADIFWERDRRDPVRLSSFIRATEGMDKLYMGEKSVMQNMDPILVFLCFSKIKSDLGC